MKPPRRIVVGMSSAALALGSGTGIATAAHRGVHGGRNGDLPSGALVIASYLGLTGDELRTQIVSGKTLAAIAVARGKSVAGLEDAIVAETAARLGAAVAAGRLTAVEQAARLADLRARVDELVTSAGRHAGAGPASPAIASYLVLTGAEIRSRLAGGASLSDLATEQGKTVAGLEDAIVADAKAHLDAAVAAGQLSADQETALLDGIRRTSRSGCNGAACSPAPPPVRTWPPCPSGSSSAAPSPRPGSRRSRRAAAWPPGPRAAPICRVPPVAVPSSGLRLAACVVARRRCRLSARRSRRHEGSAESRAHLDERRSSGATAPDPFRVSFSSIRRSRDAHQPNRRQRPPFRGLGPPRPARRHRPGRGVRGALPRLPAGAALAGRRRVPALRRVRPPALARLARRSGTATRAATSSASPPARSSTARTCRSGSGSSPSS